MQRRSHAFKVVISMLFACFVYVIYTLSKATDSANQKPNEKALRDSMVRKFDLLSVSNRKAIDDPIDLLITFTKADHNNEIQDKFRTCVSSLFNFLSVPVRLNLMSDNASRDIANHILHPWTESSHLITVSIHKVGLRSQPPYPIMYQMRFLVNSYLSKLVPIFGQLVPDLWSTRTYPKSTPTIVQKRDRVEHDRLGVGKSRS